MLRGSPAQQLPGSHCPHFPLMSAAPATAAGHALPGAGEFSQHCWRETFAVPDHDTLGRPLASRLGPHSCLLRTRRLNT